MPRPDFPRSILEFQQRFAMRTRVGATCSRRAGRTGSHVRGCGGQTAGEQSKRWLWECRSCGHQTWVTAGTVMHGTRTPLRVWFWAAYLMATHHPGISAVQHKRVSWASLAMTRRG